MQKVPRLIDKFVPKNYNLTLDIDRIGRYFHGTVTVVGFLQPDCDSVSLHSKELDIKSVTVNGKESEYQFGDNDALNITVSNSTNDLEICIDFSGKITDSMHGVYPCYYDYNDVKQELIATQFESHHAREVFPCIDEPEAKATYDLTLITEQNVTVLGNMPIANQGDSDSKLITTFETTPVMSSYLLAFVIGNLQCKTTKTKNGTEVNVWATPAQPPKSLDFALDIAKRSIEYFDDYYQTPYPLSKCDHVALPDFSSGAMENWGLITYREAALLADPENTSISSRHYIATVIAHELSHQWFGNLVTMKWWNDLWLNESFASLVEYDAIDALEPKWDVWLDFNSYESIVSLRRDSLAGVQSVQMDVNHPDEIGTLFDGAIVYAKGARLMGMMRHYIGGEVFQEGLTDYFKKHAYGNTEAKDLWLAFEGHSDKHIADFMSTWISQPGYPVVHVSRVNNQITLTQERLSSPSSPKSDSIWPIPLNSNCADIPEILESRTTTISTDFNQPIRLNVGNFGHFITHYDDEMFDEILELVQSGQLSSVDRLQFLNEQTLLARAGIIDSARLISILDAYKNETVEPVWDVMAMAAGELRKFVESDDEAEAKLRQLYGKLARQQFDRLGWNEQEGETESDTKLRSLIISMMIYSEDADTLTHAFELFRTTDTDKLDPEIRSLIIATAIRHQETDEMVENLINTYKKSNSSELRNDITGGLTSTRNPNTIKKLLTALKDTKTFKTQDTFRWIANLLRNKHARNLTWEWVRSNWKWINEHFGGDKSYDDYPRYSASSLLTRTQLQEYKDFFQPLKSDPSLSRVIEMGINEITDRVELIERDGNSVRNTLLNL